MFRQRGRFTYILMGFSSSFSLYRYVTMYFICNYVLTACSCRQYLQSISFGLCIQDLWILDDLHQGQIHKTECDLQTCQGLVYDEETMEQYLKNRMLALVLVWFFCHLFIRVLGNGRTRIWHDCYFTVVELNISKVCYREVPYSTLNLQITVTKYNSSCCSGCLL